LIENPRWTLVALKVCKFLVKLANPIEQKDIVMITRTMRLSHIIVALGLMISAKAADLKTDLSSIDAAVVRSAIQVCKEKGKEMLPDLRIWSRSENASLRLASKRALGAITGQWASQTDLVWERTFDAAKLKAKEQKKPILVLQLFGDLDAEFC